MKTRFLKLFVFLLFISFLAAAQNNQPVKVACIGNSITYGAGIKDRIRDSYPAQLARLFGPGYKVRNFGYSGRTLLNRGDHPYMSEDKFFNAVKWQPDIVIIKLGTNDSKPQNWKYKDDFEKDYNKLITAFDTLPTHPKIYLVLPVPAFEVQWGINDKVIKNEVIPMTRAVASRHGLDVIDLYTPFLGKGTLFPDTIHPGAEGSGKMAEIIYEHITGKKGELVRQELPGVKSIWHGFDKYSFDFDGRDAHIIAPHKFLNSKPWVWRARFPNWHTEMDSMLLSEGFHVVFINTNNMFGSPDAMAVWDKFYEYLVKIHGFNPKTALEGVSRGGLFVYNWAKRNPEKVSCIYAEAPVCDFKSWPGGLGTGKGSPGNWEKLKEEYDFASDEEAKAYAGNPIDGLDALAMQKVPILHMIGLKDEVVPPDENTFILIDRYTHLGGPAQIVPCTHGKQTLYGHHFEIETPRLGADFIKYHTELPQESLSSSTYHFMRNGLKNSFIKFEREKKGRVAFLGGSITYNPGWRDSLMTYMKKRFPDTKFDFIAAGIPSMGSTSGAFRIERDILKNGPVDLLFVEAAVNDGGKGRPATEIKRAMEGIVRHVRYADPTTDIVFMYFVDPTKMKDYRAGKVPEVIQYHDEVAKYYGIPAINLAKEVTDRIDAGEFTWEDDFKNLHPSPFGQGVYARSMIGFLNKAWSGFVAEDDKITDYSLPQKLDGACYDRGRLVEAVTLDAPKGWQKVDNWQPEIKAWTRANYINVPMLVGEYPVRTLKFEFVGNAVGINVAAGPDAGVIEYKIDNGPWKKKDLFTKYSTKYHLPWPYMLADGLEPGNHTLRMRLTDEKNIKSIGHRCVLRYFFYNGTE